MSSAGNVLRLRESLAGKFGERELRPQRFQAIMGDGTGAVSVPGKPNYVYVRRVGRGLIEECLNNKAAVRDGLPVIAGYSHESPEILQVLEVDWPSFSAPGDYSYIQHHHEAHELHNANGGDDVVWVQSQQLMPLLVYPTDPASLFVNVFGGWYPWVGGWHYFESTLSATFAAHVPALPAEARYVLVSIDGATETLQYTPGATFPVFLPPADAENMVPAPPAGSIPIGAVYLVFGTTAIGWDELFDMRLFNQPVGGSVTPAPHALLDVTVHSDTATAAPSQGSLIIGNATPAWDELVHPGGAGGYALVSDAATFAWSLTPAWAGAHTFNAGLAVGAGQGVTLPDPGWIGLGAALPRLTFTSGVPDVAAFDGCGNVSIENVLDHIGDPDTYLIFSPDFAGFRVGGVDMVYMDENGVDIVTFNPGEADVDFRVSASGLTDAFLVDGLTGAIKVAGPSLTAPATWNLIGPDNVVDALGIDDAGGLEYLRIVSTNANPYFLIDPAGTGIKVGIGTAAPVAPVEIYAPVAMAAMSQLQVTDGATGGYFAITEGVTGMGAYIPTLRMVSAGIDSFGGIVTGAVPVVHDVLVAARAAIVLEGSRATSTPLTAANILQVTNYGTIFVTVDVNGKVGIGTGATIPAVPLVIDSSNGNAFQISYAAAGWAVTDGFTIAHGAGDIYLNQRENANMRFWVNGAERLTLLATGTVTIPDLGGGGNQDVGADNTGLLYVPFVSDRKFKDNIEPLAGGLDVVRALRGVTFDWNTKALADVGLDFGEHGQQVGLIAQEVVKVIPLAANKGKEYESYHKEAIMSYLIEAVKELDTRLTQLEVA